MLFVLQIAASSCGYTRWELLQKPPEAQTDREADMAESVLTFSLPQYAYFKAYPPFGSHPISVERLWNPIFSALDRKLSQMKRFKKLAQSAGVPKNGLYCIISVNTIEKSVASDFFELLSVGTLTIIPYYDTSKRFRIRYELYQDGKFKRQYQYEIEQTTFQWILSPFITVWRSEPGNKFSTLRTNQGEYGDLTELITSTTELFLQDAHQDGIF